MSTRLGILHSSIPRSLHISAQITWGALPSFSESAWPEHTAHNGKQRALRCCAPSLLDLVFDLREQEVGRLDGLLRCRLRRWWLEKCYLIMWRFEPKGIGSNVSIPRDCPA
jgi:hypothetical protein